MADPTPLTQANLEMQPPQEAQHVRTLGRPEDRAEEHRQRLWQGPRGAGFWRGFFVGPQDWEDVSSPSQEYSINRLYWRRLWRIMRLGLRQPATALLAWVILFFNVLQVLALAQTILPLAGMVSSTTLTYMRLLSPRSSVRSLVLQPSVPPEVAAAVIRFQDEAGAIAKGNLWWPAEAYTGVGVACAVKPPPEWTQVMKLPGDLWDCDPPKGYIAGIGVAGSWLVWVLVVMVLYIIGQVMGAVVVLRTRLAVTKHLHKKLFSRRALYETVVLNPEIDNYDQRITDDLVTTLNYGAGRVFSCLVVPVNESLVHQAINTVLNLLAAFVRIRALGGALPLLFWVLAIGSSSLALLSYLVPIDRISRLLFSLKKCEGDLRWLYCRLTEHCETVAMYRGEACEEAAADRAFGKVYSTCSKVKLYGSVLTGLETFFTSGIMPLLSLLLLYAGRVPASILFTLWGNLNFGFTACFRIPHLYMSLCISGGPCHRVGMLLEALERGPLTSPQRGQAGQPLLDDGGPAASEPQASAETRDIQVNNVCLAPPGAPDLVLFQGLTLTITPGDPVAIVGPSGCGKSSLLRLLAQLWPPLSGSVCTPKAGGLFFLPQRSYMRTGTLGEQVSYPELYRVERAEEVKAALLAVGLGHLAPALDTVADWPSALGVGELQKLAFARLLFHRPAFALMDEATSALDLPSEARVMQLCAEKGITAVSVCHRPSAAGFHKHMLRYTGKSTGLDREPTSWKLMEIPSEDRANAGALAELPAACPRSTREEGQGEQEGQGDLGKHFIRRLRAVLGLAVPRGALWPRRCFRVILLGNCCNALFLIFGTLLSGRIAVDISNLDQTGGKYPVRTHFLLAYFVLVPPLLFLVNFTVAYSGEMLALHTRRCATDAGHQAYFCPTVPHVMNARRQECLPGTAKWQPDQRLQQDMQLLADGMAGALWGGTAGSGMLGSLIQLMLGLIFACLLTWLVSSFVVGLLVVFLIFEFFMMIPVTGATLRLQKAEGSFRLAHARVREYAESIVFHGGQATEAAVLDRLLDQEVARRSYQAIAASAGVVFAGNLTGFLLASIPPLLVSLVVFYFGPDKPGGSQITQQTLASATSFFSAILVQTTILVTTFASVGSLSGMTHRVGAFLEAAAQATLFAAREQAATRIVQHGAKGKLLIKDLTVSSPGAAPELLIESLSLEVEEGGGGLLITGESGCGKSCLMRVLAGLFPATSGAASIPVGTMFVPQKSYATGGSLREEVAYPSCSRADDTRARAALEAVGLTHLERREGLGRAANWADELSGGEMQRLGLARVFYHRPAFALLDDATSALDAATERKCLEALRSVGVTLVMASHKENLGLASCLRLQGGGKWACVAVA